MTIKVRLMRLSVAAAAAVIVVAPYSPKAAVRVCKEPVSSAVVVSKSEKVGKRRALDDWKTKAGVFGERYTSWRLAATMMDGQARWARLNFVLPLCGAID